MRKIGSHLFLDIEYISGTITRINNGEDIDNIIREMLVRLGTDKGLWNEISDNSGNIKKILDIFQQEFKLNEQKFIELAIDLISDQKLLEEFGTLVAHGAMSIDDLNWLQDLYKQYAQNNTISLESLQELFIKFATNEKVLDVLSSTHSIFKRLQELSPNHALLKNNKALLDALNIAEGVLQDRAPLSNLAALTSEAVSIMDKDGITRLTSSFLDYANGKKCLFEFLESLKEEMDQKPDLWQALSKNAASIQAAFNIILQKSLIMQKIKGDDKLTDIILDTISASVQSAVSLEPKLALQLAIDFFKTPEEFLISKLNTLIADKDLVLKASLELQDLESQDLDMQSLIRATQLLSMTPEEQAKQLDIINALSITHEPDQESAYDQTIRAMTYAQNFATTYGIKSYEGLYHALGERYLYNETTHLGNIVENALSVASADNTGAIIDHFSKNETLMHISSYICDMLTKNHPRNLLIAGLEKDRADILINGLISDIGQALQRELTQEERHRIYGILARSDDAFHAICMCGTLESLPEGLVQIQGTIRSSTGQECNLLQHINNVGRSNVWLHQAPEKRMSSVLENIIPELLKDKEGKFKILMELVEHSKVKGAFSAIDAIKALEEKNGAGYVVHELIHAFLHPDAAKALTDSGYLDVTSLYTQLLSLIQEEVKPDQEQDVANQKIQALIVQTLQYVLLRDSGFLKQYVNNLSNTEQKRRDTNRAPGFVDNILKQYLVPRTGILRSSTAYSTFRDLSIASAGAGIARGVLTDVANRLFTETKLKERKVRSMLDKNANREGTHLFLLLKKHISLDDCNLSKLNLSNINLTEVSFRGANLTFADLRGAVLVDTNLDGARLDYANLKGAVINAHTFKFILEQIRNGAKIDLYGVKLIGDLQGLDLSDLDLSGVDFCHAQTNGAILTNTILDDAKIPTDAIKGLVGIRDWQLQDVLDETGQKFSHNALDTNIDILSRDISHIIYNGLQEGQRLAAIEAHLKRELNSLSSELQQIACKLFEEQYEEIQPMEPRQEYILNSQQFIMDACMMSVQSGHSLDFCMKLLAVRSHVIHIMKEQKISLSDTEFTKVLTELQNTLSKSDNNIIVVEDTLKLSEHYTNIIQDIMSSIAQGGGRLKFLFGGRDDLISNVVKSKLGSETWVEKEVNRDQNTASRNL